MDRMIPAPRLSAPPSRMSRALAAVLTATAIAAIAIPSALILTLAPDGVRRAPAVRPPTARIVPPGEMPTVDAPRFAPVTRDDAVAFNATIPFSTAPNPPARPFRLIATPEVAARAIDCLATAQLYEAGDDVVGEQAVAQVILNRVRHPAFPKSICGVVFEGAERTTGCQFTFTCDGALQRARFGAAAWARARLVARAALTGSVFAAVGHSTHYHTDWVVPYWSTSLDKVTAVGTHLFFRWSGWWGTPAAFTRQLNGNEPVIMQLAALSSAHRDPTLGLDATEPAPATAAEAVRRRYPELAGTPDTFIVTLPANVSADELPALAALNCGERPYCKFLVWTDPAQAAKAFPLSPTEIATMGFSYLRDRATGYDKPLWNCAMFDRAQPQQCMRRQLIAADIARSPGPIVPRALPDPIAALERRQGTPMPLPRALPSPVPSPAIP